MKTVWIFLFLMLITATFCWAEDQDEASETTFRPEEIDQAMAPIALYPDDLLAQVLASATYPVDVVEADRFLQANPGLKGQALMDAAKDQDWPPSVKAMLQFPEVLSMMDRQIDWTTKVGNMFLAQQRDVMDSVQRLRQRAMEDNKLQSTSQEETVTIAPDNQVISIEPASPDVVYVPVYRPMDVYGDWWWPDYPPYEIYYPGFIGDVFLPGFYVSIGWGWGDWGCDWHRHYVVARDRGFHIGSGEHAWRHDPHYRRGVAYPNIATAQRFGGRAATTRTAVNTASFRGRERTAGQAPSGASRAGANTARRTMQPTSQRAKTPARTEQQMNTAPKTLANRSQPAVEKSRSVTNVSTPTRTSAFTRSASAASERSASVRGRTSFSSFSHSSGVSSTHAGETSHISEGHISGGGGGAHMGGGGAHTGGGGHGGGGRR